MHPNKKEKEMINHGNKKEDNKKWKEQWMTTFE